MKPKRLVFLTLALAAAITVAACASKQDIGALRAQLSEIQRQIRQIQEQASGKEEADRDAAVEADILRKLRDLSGQLEALRAKLEATSEHPSPLPPPIAPPSPIATTSDADAQSLYNSAYNDYLRGNHDRALRAFREYVTNFPNTDLSDNAVYWMGEVYYRQRRFREAIEQFDAVQSRFARSDKVASALLKKGYAHLELGERPRGITHLRSVIRQFPTSDEAELARQRLRALGVDF